MPRVDSVFWSLAATAKAAYESADLNAAADDDVFGATEKFPAVQG